MNGAGGAAREGAELGHQPGRGYRVRIPKLAGHRPLYRLQTLRRHWWRDKRGAISPAAIARSGVQQLVRGRSYSKPATETIAGSAVAPATVLGRLRLHGFWDDRAWVPLKLILLAALFVAAALL